MKIRGVHLPRPLATTLEGLPGSVHDDHEGDSRYLDTTTHYLRDLAAAAMAVQTGEAARVIQLVVTAMESGRRVFIAGNGGSASTAAHITSDLNAATHAASDLKRTGRGSAPTLGHALCLSDNTPTLTAVSNDVAYDQVFARQIPVVGREGDIFVAISVSGRSSNLLEAAVAAKSYGLTVVSLLGLRGPLCDLSDASIVVGGGDYGIAEDLHLSMGHMMVRQLRGLRSHVCAQPPEAEQ